MHNENCFILSKKSEKPAFVSFKLCFGQLFQIDKSNVEVFFILFTLFCLSSPVVTRYLEARRLLTKAAQYRPAKYKKVSPTSSPVTISVSGSNIQTLKNQS